MTLRSISLKIKSLFKPKREISPEAMEARRKILAAEEALRKMPGSMEGDCFPLHHSFADNVYVREINVPKGALLVTKIHKVAHPYFVLKGDVSVFTEEGVKRVKAPFYGITPAGTKRVCYIHEDCVWVTCHVTKETDLERIEDEIIAKSFDDVPLPAAVQKFLGTDEKNRFEVAFREMTKKVIAKEKPGFWSDWTKEQQELYVSGDWKAFSLSRGYSTDDIAEFSEWVDMLDKGTELGYKPLDMIRDLSLEAAAKNVMLDEKGEVLLSSHIPTNRIHVNGGRKCLG